LGLEAQNECAEIKIRAERKGGEMLREMELNKGGRPNENPLHDERGLTLADMGIEYTQSHRWQLIAGIPDNDFEYGTLRNAKWVATVFELSRRHDNLPFSFHQEKATHQSPCTEAVRLKRHKNKRSL